MTLDAIGKPRGLEKWLRVSNANLLTGIGTQALMVGSNVTEFYLKDCSVVSKA